MAVDSTVGSLPRADTINDDSLLVMEQQGEPKSVEALLIKNYAKQDVDVLVEAAKKAAEQAAQAAKQAQDAADSVQDVTADVEAAKAAAQAAENARLAAVQAAQYAERVAALAAEQAAQGVETKLAGYVDDAEQAKQDAQSAAGTAAQNAAGAVINQLAGYVSAAQAAQAAAEKARDEAQSIVGGDFASTDYVDSKARTVEINANAYTDQKIAAIPTPDVSGQIGAHNTDSEAHPIIQLLIAELSNRLNALANSEDVDLDQMAELVAYIKDNRELIEQITTGKISVSDIVNNLTTNVANKPLSAAQGVALKALADAAKASADSKQSKITGTAGQVVGFDANGNPVAQEAPEGGGATAVSATLTTSGWAQGADGRYAQTVAVEGVTADERQVIVVDVHLTGTDTAADAEAMVAWGPDDGSGPSSNNIKQGNGTLTFYCTAVPSINIPLAVGVH